MYAKSATTIQNILEAAQNLFISKNYNDVTMSEIADAAQVTKGALYHHFSGKQELYLKMMHNYLENQKKTMGSAVASNGTCRMRLRQLTLSFLELPPEKSELMKLVRRDINIFKNPARTQLIRAYQSALPEQVESILRDGMQSGELAKSDSRLLSWEFVALVEVVLSRYAEKVMGDSNAIADYVVNLFFYGASSKEINS